MPKIVLWHFFNNSYLSWTSANSEIFSFLFCLFSFFYYLFSDVLLQFFAFFFCSAGSAIDITSILK